MTHQVHETHTHEHGGGCGHMQIMHGEHVDYLHNGHLHTMHKTHYDECMISVSEKNPAECAEVECACAHAGVCEHEAIPHGDHVDHLVNKRLHFRHGTHCDDHGEVFVM